jgi:hypothetical protein
MAGGTQAILNLQGKVNATNAVVVTGATTGTGTGTVGTLGNLPGVVDSSNRLVVMFV